MASTSSSISLFQDDSLACCPLSVHLTCTPYIVDLRTAWKTSHSVSTQRKNALLKVQLSTVGDKPSVFKGFGEVGMPPKNALAGYHADYADVEGYTTSTVIGRSPLYTADAAAYLLSLEAADNKDIGADMAAAKLGASVLLMAILFLHSEQRCSQGEIHVKCERFGRSGVEAALLDAMGQALHVPSWALAEAWLVVVVPSKGSLIASTFNEANDITLKAATHFISEVVVPFISVAKDAVGNNKCPTTRLKGYLTVGMATPEAMAAGVAEAFTQTRFIKIKLDGDEALTYSRLLAIGAVLAKQEDRKPKVHIVIDANASWTPASTSTFAANIVRMRLGQPPELLIGSKGFEQGTPVDLPLDMTAESCKSIFEALGYAIDMIEQPYRPDFVTNVALADALPEWAAALAHCNDRGIKLFADESVCSAEDLPSLLPYVNGINIKLEKCGGLLAAFEFVEAAQRIPSISFTWIGIMVGSRLLCNTAGQLLVRTGQGDVDGALLLTEGSQLFSGGFDWIAATTDMDEAHGTISLREGSCGSGCELKVVQ